MLVKIEDYIALFFIYSFAGWVMESVNISIRNKKFKVNDDYFEII